MINRSVFAVFFALFVCQGHAKVKARFGQRIPIRVDASLVISSKFLAPQKYGQPFDALATTVGRGLSTLEDLAPNAGAVALLTGIGLFVRYGLIRALTSVETARTMQSWDFPVYVKDGHEIHQLDSDRRFILQSGLLMSSFKQRDNYVTIPSFFAEYYPTVGELHISDGT